MQGGSTDPNGPRGVRLKILHGQRPTETNPPNLIRAGGGDDGGCGGGGGSSSPPYPVLGDGLGTGWDGMASPAALAGDGSASPSSKQLSKVVLE
ncbi:hypothetical protein DAI22_08g205801 [Oryza sativa Japonica Group]|nr:hypothetical protein DAI22_08g205801 [Oryza sativa Japonica Group]